MSTRCAVKAAMREPSASAPRRSRSAAPGKGPSERPAAAAAASQAHCRPLRRRGRALRCGRARPLRRAAGAGRAVWRGGREEMRRGLLAGGMVSVQACVGRGERRRRRARARSAGRSDGSTSPRRRAAAPARAPSRAPGCSSPAALHPPAADRKPGNPRATGTAVSSRQAAICTTTPRQQRRMIHESQMMITEGQRALSAKTPASVMCDTMRLRRMRRATCGHHTPFVSYTLSYTKSTWKEGDVRKAAASVLSVARTGETTF